MKFFLLIPVLLSVFSTRNLFSADHFHDSFFATDTSFKHITDGKDTEWPEQKFEMDPATEIKYALDNDTQNLYLALIIPDSRMQTKMMRNGMELYIDSKAKKKEGKGIEFPVKRDPSTDNSLMNFRNQGNEEGNEQETPEQRKAKMKTIRAAMALNLTSIKVFGFAGDQPEEQGLAMPGSAIVAFAWDTANIMCIEYKIPLSLLEVSASFTQKDISVGWKVNGFQKPSGKSSSGSSGGNHHGGYGGGGGRRNSGSGGYGNEGNKQQDFENSMKDQSFWTKYMFK
ncbi:MAG: hypothetical protein ACHQF0_07030 [Chitinophagales bacterium]